MKLFVKFIVLYLGVGLLMCVGCGMLELQTAPDGTVSTQLTTAIGAAGDMAKSVSLFFPIAGAIGGVLSLTANGILGVIARKKSTQATKIGTALEAVASGVNAWTKNFVPLKENILLAVKESGGDTEKARQALEKADSIKAIISMIAENKEIESFLKIFIKNGEGVGTIK